ncbi:Suppressor of presenilin protein 4 [Dirofilaria immitis]|nr:Suppressor of presenilin protein 4 [Dirofilaria immitis]
MKSKRSTAGKRGKRNKNLSGSWDSRQNHANLDPADVELQKWRMNRMNYLKSRVSHIHLKSPSPVNGQKLTDERNKNDSPTTSKITESPLQLAEITTTKSLLNSRKQLEQKTNYQKAGRKVPLRHLDFISDNSDGKNLESKHITITDCLKQPNKSQDKQTYHCSICPSFFTSRRGMANHYKLHGASKDISVLYAILDHLYCSCDNYKTLQMHKAFHTAANKEESESITSAHLTLVIDSCADSEKIKRETKEMNEKTGAIIASNREFACFECPFISRDQNRLQKHLVGHRRTVGFKCSLCTYMSASAGFLKRHCELHKPEIYQWPPVYISKGSLRITTTSTDPVKSEEIEKQLKIPRSSASSPLTTFFVNEKQPVVTDDLVKQLRCKYCTFSCRSTVVLLQHLRLHQQIPKLLQMPGRPKDLHTNEGASTSSFKMEKCSECPYISRHICDLRTHAQMHVGKREFACGQCTYSTKRSHVLDAHLQLHMAEKEGITVISNTNSRSTLAQSLRHKLVDWIRKKSASEVIPFYGFMEKLLENEVVNNCRAYIFVVGVLIVHGYALCFYPSQESFSEWPITLRKLYVQYFYRNKAT